MVLGTSDTHTIYDTVYTHNDYTLYIPTKHCFFTLASVTIRAVGAVASSTRLSNRLSKIDSM